MVYRHYGSEVFDRSRMQKLKNHKSGKPGSKSCLWASPLKTDRDWKSWCEDNGYNEFNLSKWFDFVLEEDTRIKFISSKEDIESLPLVEGPHDLDFLFIPMIDYEKLQKEGYDGIELCFNSETEDRFRIWDCSSLVVWNAGKVREIDSSKEASCARP